MPVRAVCKNLTLLTSKRGALATDARGCSLWRSLLERPPPAPESRVRDPFGELVRTRVGGVTYIYIYIYIYIILGVAQYTDVTVQYVPWFVGHGSMRFRYNRNKKKSTMLGFLLF